MIVNNVGLFGALPVTSPIKLESGQGEEEGGEESGSKFAGGFAEAIKNSWEAGAELSAVNREGNALLLTGQLEDLPEHMVNGEKSSILFEYNLNVRNKLLDAYAEILKTQI